MRIGIVGDPHGCWGPADTHYFNRSPYDLVLVTGDLGTGTARSALEVTRELARLRRPTLIMLGNNDAPYAPRIAAELQHLRGLSALALGRLPGKVAPARQPLALQSDVMLCGYSCHPLMAGTTLIAARPLATGGDQFSYPERLRELYDVSTSEHSVRRLVQLVAESGARNLVFFAHNGPRGLGDHAAAMWGCDFLPEEGDYGDSDLAAAVHHARALGKRVLAVIAGHMHLRTKQGPERPCTQHRDGILYVNAARVPRVFPGAHGLVRHHVALHIDADGVGAREVLVHEDECSA